MSTGWELLPESSFSAISITSFSREWDQHACNQNNRIVPTGWDLVPEPSTLAIPTSLNSDSVTESSRTRSSWIDMTRLEDKLLCIEDETKLRGEEEEKGGQRGKRKMELSREQKELNRFRNVTRNKEFECLKRVGRRVVNVVSGLELHPGVFSPIEQKRIVDFVYHLLDKGRKGELGGMFFHTNLNTEFYRFIVHLLVM
jgi:mRNA N6-methyladenine demethylase